MEDHPADVDTEFIKKQVFGLYGKLEELAGKRFPGSSMSELALNYVLDELSRDNWKCLRSHKRESGLRVFIITKSRWLLEDFSRKEFGAPRTPKWIKDRGYLWIQMYKMLCLERMSVTDVVESLSWSGPMKRDKKKVEAAAQIIQEEVTNCREFTGDRTEEKAPENPVDGKKKEGLFYLTPEELATERERHILLQALSIFSSDNPGHGANKRLSQGVLKLRQSIKLDAEESLFLKSIYQEGRNVSASGRLMGWDANKAARTHKKLLEAIRKAVKRSGLEQELKSLVEF